MELKGYQQKVIKDLESYLGYLRRLKRTDLAFDQYWADRIGPYNPVTGEGMEPYKNIVPQVPHVCIKVPTAGGKTFIACNALHSVFQAFPSERPKAVVWLVPWSNLLSQTISNLGNPGHPYRQKLDALFQHRVAVYGKDDLLQGANFNATVVQNQLSIFVLSFSSLRAKNKDDRKAYQENSQLSSFAPGMEDGADDTTSLINVIRSLQPVLVVDESHNAESDLSVDMLKILNPSFILDLTATPRQNSNIVSIVPAIELKKEHMVKLPVIIYNHHDRAEVINSALHLQHKLEQSALAQQQQGGRYIRPIVLFQAQSKTNADNTTFEKIREQLLLTGIPEEQIKIKTAEKDELKGIDLMSPDCPVRYIITVNALREGWDCPFAYILASLADRSSTVEVEQILGRVLRQPYVSRHTDPLLNVSYVLTASARFNETLNSIVEGLQACGFSQNDYREKDLMREEEKQQAETAEMESVLFPEQEKGMAIDFSKISFRPATEADATLPPVVADIGEMVGAEGRKLDAFIAEQTQQPADENIYQEMGDKIKRYRMIGPHRASASDIRLPQFYLRTPPSDIFGTHEVLLNRESLLTDFRLSQEDTKIDFEQTGSDVVKVDIEQTNDNEYAPRIAKIENDSVRGKIIDYILAKPLENQRKDVAYRILKQIGTLYPIDDKEIELYISRVLESTSTETLHRIVGNESVYAPRIISKIEQLADAWAEKQFADYLKVKRVTVKNAWRFPEMIVPGNTAPSIAKSLYEREGSVNNSETDMIREISGLDNILFWHRNLGRGKGFALNGYKSNHYPDFILVTKSGNVIVLETKGGDRDNSDSMAKARLGKIWQDLGGDHLYYFMVFDQHPVENAYLLSDAIKLIRQL